jgi:hypothetical protein
MWWYLNRDETKRKSISWNPRNFLNPISVLCSDHFSLRLKRFFCCSPIWTCAFQSLFRRTSWSIPLIPAVISSLCLPNGAPLNRFHTWMNNRDDWTVTRLRGERFCKLLPELLNCRRFMHFVPAQGNYRDTFGHGRRCALSFFRQLPNHVKQKSNFNGHQQATPKDEALF